jgi:hypothetical protein
MARLRRERVRDCRKQRARPTELARPFATRIRRSHSKLAILTPVLRLSRRFTTALLWLAIVLLPVRGWAATLMPMTQPAEAVAVGVADAKPAAAMPCHGVQAPADDGAATEAPGSHTCSLCDLCHTTVAHAPAAPTVPPAAHDTQPPDAASPRVDSRLPDGLFRPPRSVLA